MNIQRQDTLQISRCSSTFLTGDAFGGQSVAALPSPELALDYTDVWPVVEVTVAVNEILHLDFKDLSFEADFTIYLDWVDPKLRRGEHYEYNADKAKFELVKSLEDPKLRDAMDDLTFFNPRIRIENSKQYAQAETDVPYIFDEVVHEGKDVPWLTKKYNFLGFCTCRQVHALTFPFDIQGLQIRICSEDMEGVTSLGQQRRISLREPLLRKDFRYRLRGSHPLNVGWACVKQQSEEVMAHMWKLNDEDGEAFGFGEMRVLAIGGVVDDINAYTFHIVLRRQWYPRYVFDFLIQNLQVLAATFGSLYIPFTPDMLVNRMTIALTVLLTLVSSLSTRPALIEAVPYSTFYDYYGQIMVFSVCLICFSNWLVYVSCWGMYRSAGSDDYWDEDKHMVVSNLREGLFSNFNWNWCEQGQCGASAIDCVLLYAQMGAQVVFTACVLLVAQMARITTLLKIKHQVDAPDRQPGRYSRLVLCENGFEFCQRMDVKLPAAYAAMLPCVALFMKIWFIVRFVKTRLRRCFICGSSWKRRQEDTFHAMDAHDLLERSTDEVRRKSRNLPQISGFNMKLSPHEQLRMLDVGSGEMGFYCYWQDPLTKLVRTMGNTKKVKYSKNSTFVDDFVKGADGPDKLAALLIERFELTQPTVNLKAELFNIAASRSSLLSVRPSRLMTKEPPPLDGDCSPAMWSPAHSVNVDEKFERGREVSGSFLAAWAASGQAQPPGLPGAGPVMRACPTPPEPQKPREMQAEFASLGGGSTAVSTTKVFEDLEDNELLSTNKSNPNLRLGMKKKKLLMCLTGANRQMLSEDDEGRRVLHEFIVSVNKLIEEYGVECIPFSPQDVDEALYELCASEWVVQHGDLNVSTMKLGRPYRTLQQGREDAYATLDEVLTTYMDLGAESDLTLAFAQAAAHSPRKRKVPTRAPRIVRQMASKEDLEECESPTRRSKRALTAPSPAVAAASSTSESEGDSQSPQQAAVIEGVWVDEGGEFYDGLPILISDHRTAGEHGEEDEGMLEFLWEASRSGCRLIKKGKDGTRATFEATLKVDGGIEVRDEKQGMQWELRRMEGRSGNRQHQGLEDRPHLSRVMASLKESHVCCKDFYKEFNRSNPLLRALVRSRLFVGTLSAGSGSSQVTLRNATNLEASEMSSIPLGNRTPVTTMILNEDDPATPISWDLPETRKLALQFFVDSNFAPTDSMGRIRRGSRGLAFEKGKKRHVVTRPNWSEDGPVTLEQLELWEQLVKVCCEERQLPQAQRGLFVGITAVFYAAQLAGVEGAILPRDEFIDKLIAKRDEIMASGAKDGRGLANLALVKALVEFVLHRTALIVCKRTWKVGGDMDIVATWSLGLYLKHAGVLATRSKADR